MKLKHFFRFLKPFFDLFGFFCHNLLFVSVSPETTNGCGGAFVFLLFIAEENASLPNTCEVTEQYQTQKRRNLEHATSELEIREMVNLRKRSKLKKQQHKTNRIFFGLIFLGEFYLYMWSKVCEEEENIWLIW